MSSLLSAIIHVGLVPAHTVLEMRRWGVVIPDTIPDPPKHPEQVAAALESVLRESGMQLVRETDLDVVSVFVRTQVKGELSLLGNAPFPVSYGTTPNGEILLPWQGESITDLLQDPGSFLQLATEQGRCTFHVTDVRELFFGEQKAFLVCSGEFRKPAEEESP